MSICSGIVFLMPPELKSWLFLLPIKGKGGRPVQRAIAFAYLNGFLCKDRVVEIISVTSLQ